MRAGEKQKYSQLQQSQVSIAVKGPVLALLHHVVLEDGGRLWVVSVEAAENGINVRRARLALVEGENHGFCLKTVSQSNILVSRASKGASFSKSKINRWWWLVAGAQFDVHNAGCALGGFFPGWCPQAVASC